MSLAETQRALARVCFDREPAHADLARLAGDPGRWKLYRTMVRTRLYESVSAGLPRTRSALGEGPFARVFDDFLATAPPRTRLIRAVTGEFARHLDAVPADADGFDARVPYARDLCRYEAARLAVLHADAPPVASTLAEFAMERPAEFSPAIRLVNVTWDVHVPTRPDGHAHGAWTLLVYRDEGTHAPDTLVLSPTAGDLVHAMAPGETPVAACIRTVIARHGGTADAAFLESVAELLGDLMERGVLLGGCA